MLKLPGPTDIAELLEGTVARRARLHREALLFSEFIAGTKVRFAVLQPTDNEHEEVICHAFSSDTADSVIRDLIIKAK